MGKLANWKACYRDAVTAAKSPSTTVYQEPLLDRANISGRYVPDTVFREIQKFTKLTCARLQFRNTSVELDIFHAARDKVTRESIDRELTGICMAIAFLYRRMGSHRAKAVVKMQWFRCHLPKVANANEFALDTNHVNTGYTMLLSGNIVIFRVEEAIKVMIHELIHLWRYDRDLLDIDTEAAVEACLPSCGANRFRIRNTEMHMGVIESVTDTIAIMIYTAFCVHERGAPGFTFSKAMADQKEHVLEQAARVMSLQRFQRMEELRDRDFVERTHVFAYYVIKAALMFRWRGFERVAATETAPSKIIAEMISLSLIEPRFVEDMNKRLRAHARTHRRQPSAFSLRMNSM